MSVAAFQPGLVVQKAAQLPTQLGADESPFGQGAQPGDSFFGGRRQFEIRLV